MAEQSERGEPTDDSFEALLRQAAPPSHVSARPALANGDKLAGDRFEIVRRLGEGGMGVVYEAVDTQRRAKVALKTLSRVEPAGIYRLKNEFRALADVSHPNLVRLYELFGDDALWFFTMDLVDGARFDTWVRPGGALDEARLRSALPQLVAAVDAIHVAGKLHRDLKPSNVLVTHEGRVVVLDFGLAVDPEPGGVGQTVADDSVSGTPAYMAPEQAAGGEATTASDYYAVGVMVFEALTGKVPFGGRVHEMLVDKQRGEAPRASTLAEAAPADLDALCAQLLARAPAARPDAAALRAQLGLASTTSSDVSRASAAPRARGTSRAEADAPELLGRAPELQALRDAFAATLSGTPVVLFVSGESGMGKSALCEAFADALRAQGRATVLAGRCYERENVPFKGFDALVDDLSRHLRKLSDADASAVLPREAYALARIFPVLERIAAVAAAPKKKVADPQDLKRRAFDAFGELLGRMRDRAPLVILLDDAQWLDQDATRFMRALLVHPEPAAVLFVCAHRSEGAQQNALLQSVLQGARDNAKLDVRELRVGALPEAALRTLVQRLLPDADERAAAALAGEAQGSPFFAAELARAAVVRDRAGPSPSLAEALALHVGALPAGAQRLLSLLALAGQPLPAAVVVDAAGDAEGHTHVDRLRSEHLVRVSIGVDGVRSVECYHDKIREQLAAQLVPSEMRQQSLALARALGSREDASAELLAHLLDLADLPAEAATHAARAAESAAAALAFDRAATLYARALERGQFAADRLQALRVGRADALARAGRAEAGAEAYLAAAEHAAASDAQALELKAGEHYLLCGNLERGRALLDQALRRVGHSLPQSALGAVAAVAWSRTRLRLRGLSFVPRAQHDAATLRELEALHVAVNCLERCDQLRAADFSARCVLRALAAGHAVWAARALASEVLIRSLIGAPLAQVDAAAALCAELCEQTGDQWAVGAFLYGRGFHAIVRLSRPDEALAHFDREVALIAAAALHTAAYDLAWTHSFRSLCLMVNGRFAEAGEIARVAYEDVVARGDHISAGVLALPLCWSLLATGRTVQAGRLVEEERTRLRWGEVTIQDGMWLGIRLYWGVYEGQERETWRDTAEERTRYFGSWQGRSANANGMRLHCSGIAAVLASACSDVTERRALQREARRLAKSVSNRAIEAEKAQRDALLACLDGDRARAIAALRRGIPPALGPTYAHISRRRLGELLRDDEGAALIAEADAFMREGGVVDPARYTGMMMPGLELP